MSTEPSVHDNNLYSYCIDCEGRRIVLHTEFAGREPHEFTDIEFLDVVAHYFEHVLPGNILFDVEETDVETLVQDCADLFADSWRYGWPPFEYDGDLKVLSDALKAASVRAYVISSSYGLSGWVLAGGSRRLVRESAAKIS